MSSINVTDTTALAFDYEEGENDKSVFPGIRANCDNMHVLILL